MHKILLIEDSLPLTQVIVTVLEQHSSKVLCAHRLDKAEALLDRQIFDLVLLDRSLPDGDGIDLLAKIRTKRPSLQVLMISNRVTSHDRIFGLQRGADDYLIKPFATEELLLRVQKLLHSTKRLLPEELQVGELCLFRQTGQVKMGETFIQLRPKEFQLLWFLASHHDTLLTRQQILNHVWPESEQPLSETLDVYVRRIRQALAMAGKRLKTVKGFGYMWSLETQFTEQSEPGRLRPRLASKVRGLADRTRLVFDSPPRPFATDASSRPTIPGQSPLPER